VSGAKDSLPCHSQSYDDPGANNTLKILTGGNSQLCLGESGLLFSEHPSRLPSNLRNSNNYPIAMSDTSEEPDALDFTWIHFDIYVIVSSEMASEIP